MFTGIVQGLGEVLAVDQRAPDFRSHTVRLPEGANADLRVGASVAHNGCCLTIGTVSDNEFNVHLIPETLNRTLFGSRRAGERVNVEIDPQTQVIVDTVARILAEKDKA